jgi:hypothetical protein
MIQSSVGRMKAEPSCPALARAVGQVLAASEKGLGACRRRRLGTPPCLPLVRRKTGGGQVPAQLDASVVKRLVERAAGSAVALGENVDRHIVQREGD